MMVAMREARPRSWGVTPKAFGSTAPSARHSPAQSSPMPTTSVRSFLQLLFACPSLPAPSSAPAQAVAALVSLGYTPSDAAAAVARVDETLPVQDIIKVALRGLSRAR